MAKKSSISKLVTKSDLRHLEGRLDRRIDTLDRRMDALDRRIDALEARLVVSETRILKKIELLTSAVDRYFSLSEKRDQELKVLRHQLQRHEAWINRIAQKVGLSLEEI